MLSPVGAVRRWAMRALAALAMVGSGVLAYEGFRHGALPGCGTGSGCDQVLGSDWAHWFGIPVGAPALLLYALMLGATLHLGPTQPAQRQRFAWGMLWIGAVIALGAAVWFTLVQGLIVQAFCKYCITVHLSGAALALLVFVPRPTTPAEPTADPDQAGPERSEGADHAAAPRLPTARLTLVGLVPVAALVLGQWLQPPPSMQLIEVAPRDATRNGPPDDAVPLLGGAVHLVPAGLPTIGPEAPDVWAALLFDYTCPHCRATHRYLLEALERYGDQLGLIMLPVPLDADCNPTLEHTHATHEDGCELAHLALAVASAEPARFPAFDAWLMADDDPPALDEARARAEALVDETALRAALADDSLTEQIHNNVRIYQAAGARRVPTLIVGDRIFAGRPASAAALFESLETQTELQPIAQPPDAADSQHAGSDD